MPLWRVVPKGVIFSQVCQNVLHFARDASGLTTAQIRDELISGWFPILRNLQNNNFAWTQVSIQQILPTLQPPDVYALSNQAGSLSGTAAVPVIAGLFSLRTAAAGRTGHGRFYMPGVHQDSVLNGANGAVGTYQTRANDLMNRYGHLGSGPFEIVVTSRTQPSNYKSVTAIIVRPTWGVQRRRNIGVGN